MKTKHLLLSFVGVAAISWSVFLNLFDAHNVNIDDKSYQVRAEQELNSKPVNGASGAAEWLRQIRLNPATGTLSDRDVSKARESFNAMSLKRSDDDDDMNWQFMGPDDVGGRTRAILVDNRDNTLWAGGVAGGLWKSTTNGLSWIPIAIDELSNITISSMCQDADGNIYFGTGENFAGLTSSNITTTGFAGDGVWKYAASGGLTKLFDAEQFGVINELVYVDAFSKLYAATLKGLYVSDNHGVDWTIVGDSHNQKIQDVKATSDGKVVYSQVYYIYEEDFYGQNYDAYLQNVTIFQSNDGVNFENKSSYFDLGFDRIEIAVSPSDENIMYSLCSYGYWYDEKVYPDPDDLDNFEFINLNDNKYFNLYKSVDAGQTWTSLVTHHTALYDVFRERSQGNYDNVIEVFPNDPNRIIFGGIDLWTWSLNNSFQQISYWQGEESGSALYVHADQHKIVFHPDYETNKTIYFGCDGGVFRSLDGAQSFTAINKNYGVTQYYAIDCGPNGEVLGGTQDNGTPYIDLLQPSDSQSSWEVTGGDGGHSAVSELYRGALFTTLYYSELNRSNENGASATMQENPYDKIDSRNTLGQIDPGYFGNRNNPFVTPISLWESFDYDSSRIYFPFIVDTILKVNNEGIPDTIVEFDEGAVMIIQSTTISPRSFEHIISAEDIARNGGAYVPGDTLIIREKFASMLAVGAYEKIYFTREGLNFKDKNPNWDAVSGLSKLGLSADRIYVNDDIGVGKVTHLKWANDGETLYAISTNTGGTGFGSKLFRFKGFTDAYSQESLSYDNRILSQETVSDVTTEDVSAFELLVDAPIKVWAMTYAGVDNRRVINIDTTNLAATFDIKNILFNECDTTFVNGIDINSIVNTPELVAVKYPDYSLSTGGVAYNSIFSIDSLFPGLDTLVNINYKEFNPSCQIVYIDSINIDTISAYSRDSIEISTYSLELLDGTVFSNVVSLDTINPVYTFDVTSQDTTYEMGVMSDDMVWNNRKINTTDNIVGELLMSFGGRIATSVDVDPDNSNNILVTVGGYGIHHKVYYSSNANEPNITDVDLDPIDGPGLVEAPVYSSLIARTYDSGTELIIGTEYGVYSTKVVNGTSTEWTRQAQIPAVPVFSLVQQTQPNGYLPGVCVTGVENEGEIYAGTHGLGVWRMDKYKQDVGVKEVKSIIADEFVVKVYPNPVKDIANVEYSVVETSDVEIEIYSLSGQQVYRNTVAQQNKGTYVQRINTETLGNGVYVISVTNNNERKVSKFIVE